MKETECAGKAEDASCALRTNAQAVRAVSGAVEGTIGPKGLDVMLIGRGGEVLITNDGVTILEEMEADHPAAQMLVHMARSQQETVGDGTTTATLLAEGLISAGADQAARGVPVVKIIEGIRLGAREALAVLDDKLRYPAQGGALLQIAMVAGRAHQDIAGLVVEAAQCVGEKQLGAARFHVADIILAEENARNEVFGGVLVTKERMNREMPMRRENVRVLVMEDALEAEEIKKEALSTESGLQKYLGLQEEFKENLQKLLCLNVGLVLTDRNIGVEAEMLLADAGIMAARRVERTQLERVAEHTGARLLQRAALKKAESELAQYLGFAAAVHEDERLRQIRINGGGGSPAATMLVGASTKELVGERLRIACDAAASVQAAVKGGIVAGGGAVEIAMARRVSRFRAGVSGMEACGVDCVIAALKRPIAQIVKNAGYNPLEKVEAVIAAQNAAASDVLGINCDDGGVEDMRACGIIDPAPVKQHALKAAVEVAISILRIEKIMRRKTADESAP